VLQRATQTERLEAYITVPATDAAKQWLGFGTALKPAVEPVCLARKPLSENTVANNVLELGHRGAEHRRKSGRHRQRYDQSLHKRCKALGKTQSLSPMSRSSLLVAGRQILSLTKSLHNYLTSKRVSEKVAGETSTVANRQRSACLQIGNDSKARQ